MTELELIHGGGRNVGKSERTMKYIMDQIRRIKPGDKIAIFTPRDYVVMERNAWPAPGVVKTVTPVIAHIENGHINIRQTEPLLSFVSVGEISSEMQGRVDMERYAAGVERVDNFFPTRSGPMNRRPSAPINEAAPVSKSAWRKLSGPSFWQRHRNTIWGIVVGAAAGMALVAGLLYGIGEEMDYRRALAEERCASYGEGMTPAQARECEGIGQ